MIYRIPGYASKGLTQPDDFRDPMAKDRDEYALEWSWYMYDRYCGDSEFLNFLTEAERIDKYAEGRQDPSTYMNMLLDDMQQGASPKIPVVNSANEKIGEAGGAREGYMSVNFKDIFNPMPKYMQVIYGKMESQEHDVTPEAIDPFSTDWKQDIKLSARIRGELQEWKNEIMMSMDMPAEDIVLPTAPEEMEMWSMIGAFKLPYEVGQERIIEDSLENHNWPKIKQKIIYDAVKYNRITGMVETDPVNGEVVPVYLDPKSTYVEGCMDDDHLDSRFGFTIRYFPVSYIRETYGWSDEDVKKLVALYDARMSEVSPTTKKYGGFRIPILIGYYRTVNSEYRTAKRRDSGMVKEIIEPWDNGRPPKQGVKGKRITSRTQHEAIYEIQWPIGYDRILSTRRMADTPFDYSTRRCDLPIFQVSLVGNSIGKSAIKPLDMIALSMFRLENAIAKSPPPGIAIDIDKLNNVAIGRNTMKPIDIIRMYRETGDYVYSLSLKASGASVQTIMKPIEELRGGLGTSIVDAIQSMEFHLRNLAEVTGLDRISSVSKTPGAEQGAAVTQIAVAATEDNLRPIYRMYLSFKERIVKHVVLKGQAVITAGGQHADRYKNIIGNQAFEAMKIAASKTPQQWGFVTKAHPTEQMRAEIRQAAQIAMAGGKNGQPAITQSEYLFIVQHLNSVDGINTSRAYLEYKEKKREEMDAKRMQETNMLQERMKQQGDQIKAATEMAKLEAQKQIIVLQSQLDKDRALAEIAAKRDADIAVNASKPLTTSL